jgi:hypothetical protein
MEEPETANNNKVIITIAAVFIMAVIVVAAAAASPKKRAETAMGSGAAAHAPAVADNASSTSFKDGSYMATGSYESPGGNEHITVHVTLKGGVVTTTSADSGAEDPEAHEYQSMFIGGYASQIVGKPITAVHLSRVSGSSLTSQGFNDAINQIENEAKA